MPIINHLIVYLCYSLDSVLGMLVNLIKKPQNLKTFRLLAFQEVLSDRQPPIKYKVTSLDIF